MRIRAAPDRFSPPRAAKQARRGGEPRLLKAELALFKRPVQKSWTLRSFKRAKRPEKKKSLAPPLFFSARSWKKARASAEAGSDWSEKKKALKKGLRFFSWLQSPFLLDASLRAVLL